MKPTLFLTSLLAAATSLVSAAPTEKPELKVRDGHHDTERFLPDIMVQIKEHEPDHAFGDTTWGVVSRRDGKEQVNTLLSIFVPHHTQGQKCRFSFTQPHDLGGSMTAQLFTVIGKVPYEATFNKRPSRDRHIATFKISWAHAQADFEHFGRDAEFDCPAGKTVHYELVPVGDNDYIEWYDPYGFAIETVHW